MKRLLLALLLLLPVQSHAARLFVASNSDKIVYPASTIWTTQISASVWIYPVSLPTSAGSETVLISNLNSNVEGLRVYLFSLYNDTGSNLRLYFSYNTSLNAYQICNTSSAVSLSTGTWQHIAYTFDNAVNPDTCAIYIDGVSQGTSVSVANAAGPFDAGAPACRIGSARAASERGFFDGRIAEPAIWTDVPILNQLEATALARGARADKVRLNPTRYYPLEGWQTTEPDYGSAHQGTTSITGTSRADGPPLLPR